MKISTPPLVIDDEDTFRHDALNRKGYAEALLNLIEQADDQLVIALDGRWGEGKTTFVKMWQGLLDQSSVPNIYIDAFANDYIDDAFVSIISEVTSFVESNIHKDHVEKVEELKKKAVKVGGQLLTWSTRVGIKAATLGAIKDSDLDELQDIKNDIAKGVSSVAADLIQEKLNSHAQDIEALESFKELLSNIPSQLASGESKPLVIIIDELDRCKPTFAIELIEKIKHVFSVENIIFVLVMHKEQLEEAVKCVYGQNIDAHTYLQKFINLETSIPKRIEHSHASDIRSYCHRLTELHELETWGDSPNIIDCIEPLAKHFNLSLRQLEKIYTQLTLFYSSIGENHLRTVPIIVFLSVVKVINPAIFERVARLNISYENLCSELNLPPVAADDADERSYYWIMQWLQFAILTQQAFDILDENDSIRGLGRSLFPYSISREELMPFLAKQLSLFKTT